MLGVELGPVLGMLLGQTEGLVLGDKLGLWLGDAEILGMEVGEANCTQLASVSVPTDASMSYDRLEALFP